MRNTIDRKEKLFSFLATVLPIHIPRSSSGGSNGTGFTTREEFLEDVHEGMKAAPMSVRLTPHVLSVANWNNAIEDPIRRQFVPLKSAVKPDHPALSLDSLCEENDSPVPGLVHRYPDKVLFLGEFSTPPLCPASETNERQRLPSVQYTAASAHDRTPLATTPNR